ncbi:MAG TPA: multicopper oxidase domain-containing protein [Candidatus Limnocylindrales bacterium]|nr:multicopper oxidase domain-containing protein [Candidatus Limnocylindrales bacterium]
MKKYGILLGVMILLEVLFLAVSAPAVERHYWIAADEVMWDYAPSFPVNLMTGEEFDQEQRTFVEKGIGRIYLKAVYREYLPGFAALKPRSPEEAHLGILGPIIRAEVGDTVKVHFRNNTRFPLSIHPHGVFYDKNSEGSPYADGTILKADDAVPPFGGTHTYIWRILPRAGPGPMDPSSIVWVYHGHTHETADSNSGLIGPIIITRKGSAKIDGSPIDVDREFVSLFTIFDENESLYLEENIARCTKGPCNRDDEDFKESNLKHSINGLLWGNNTGYVMRMGEHVRWYLIAMGTEVDIHTPHWHGVTVLHQGSRLDVIELFPATTKTVDLIPDDPGNWMFHCHVNDHIKAGMMTLFTILP